MRINDAPVFGVAALTNTAPISIRRSFITNTNTAVLSAGEVNVDDSEIYKNTIAMNVNASGALITLNNNSIYVNTTGFMIAAGATIASAGNNKTSGNGGAGPNGMLTSQ